MKKITILGFLAILGLAAVITALLLGVGTQELASEGLEAGWEEPSQHSPLNNETVFEELDGVEPPTFPSS